MLRFVASASGIVVVLAGFASVGIAEAPREFKMDSRRFGEMPDGTPVDEYTFTNAHGAQAKIIPYGGIITGIVVPDREGKLDDVALGFNDLKGYLAGHPFFGCLVGRVANRIAKGKFTLDGKTYSVAINNPPNALHGGKEGFDKKVWKIADKGVPVGPKAGEGKGWLRLSYLSKDGEEGYPGNLSCEVTYTWTDDNELRIEYKATTDKPTPVNLTNHNYFNLRGTKMPGDVLGHEMMLAASKYTPTDDTLIPTGKIEPLAGTPYDFTKSTPIGARIDQLKGEPRGYDVNYALDSGGGKLALAARVTEPKTGRVMEMLTTEPGVQFYTGNFLDGTLTGKGGVVYKKHYGLCLEAQHFPDALNHSDFATIVLKPGQTYTQTTVYKFSNHSPVRKAVKE
jgi:aldose 1-epimerase